MKRIFASLFVVVALVSVGVFATSAYFTASTNVTGVTFTAGTSDIGLGFCDGANCGIPSIDAAGGVSIASPVGLTVGPGYTHTWCVAVEAINYAQDITQTLSSLSDPYGLSAAVDLTIAASNSSCATGGATLVSSTLNNFNNFSQALATPLAAGSYAYFLETVAWNTAADQSNQDGLQGKALSFNVTLSGVTPH